MKGGYGPEIVSPFYLKGAKLSMSMADLKSRMTDIPGSAGMIMTVDAGQMIYTISGQDFAFDAAASDATIEATIRAGIKTDAAPAAITTEPATSVAVTEPAPAPAASVAPVAAPAPAAPVASVSTPAAAQAPAAHAFNVKDMMAQHSADMNQLIAVQKQLLQTALDNQKLMVGNAIGSVAAKIQTQTDDFAAVMGQFTNDLGI